MLSAVLSGNGDARDSQRLVREQRLAVSAGTDYDTLVAGPGMFYLIGTPSADKSVAEMEAGMRAEIARVQEDGCQRRRARSRQGATGRWRDLQARLDVRAGNGNRSARSGGAAVPAR